MKSIVVEKNGGPEVLLLKDVPKPTVKPGHILVKNSYAGVNYIDTYFRTGLYKGELPMVLGKEGAGVIEEVGEGVSGLKPGDRVAYLMGDSGAYAEYALVNPSFARVLPGGISDKIGAAALLQGMTAYCLAAKAYAVKGGDWVLVHAAAGGTGRLIVQVCRALGANVIGTVSTEEKAEVARKAGAQHIIYYTRESVPERVKEITSNTGVRVVYDGVGKATFQASFDSLARLGYLIVFGNASGKPDPVDISILAKGNITLMRPQLYGFIATKEEFDEVTDQVFKLIEAGHLTIEVFKEYPLADAAKAHIDLEGRKTTGKLLIAIQ
ncbi:hypothetical protein EV182_001465 [Spiromyces aspiralis]|uniref:Uncharacterized protein n=1 Tax=Spiromyces aspiralis TaxID=68401 RepID=A0ACC1HWM6_9FUNG|nr:hypothetical protein EV182_001465 [Spiromyces aspiralis]